MNLASSLRTISITKESPGFAYSARSALRSTSTASKSQISAVLLRGNLFLPNTPEYLSAKVSILTLELPQPLPADSRTTTCAGLLVENSFSIVGKGLAPSPWSVLFGSRSPDILWDYIRGGLLWLVIGS